MTKEQQDSICRRDHRYISVFGREPSSIAKAIAVKDCIHLGLRVNVKTGSCRGSYECDNGHGVVRPCVECKTCGDYQTDDVV